MEEICIYAAELLDCGDELLETLVVNTDKMKENIELLGGLTQSEHVMLALGKKIGKQHAHHIINEIAVRSFKEKMNFEEELCKDKRVNCVLIPEEIHDLLDPMKYIGKCPEMARQEVEILRKKIQ